MTIEEVLVRSPVDRVTRGKSVCAKVSIFGVSIEIYSECSNFLFIILQI